MIYLKLHVFPSPRSFLRGNKALSSNQSPDFTTGDAAESNNSISEIGVERAAVDVAIGGALDAYRKSVSIASTYTPKGAWMMLSSLNPPQDVSFGYDIDVDIIWHSDMDYGTLDVAGTVLLMVCAPNADTYYLVTPDSQSHLHAWLSHGTVQEPLVHVLKKAQVSPVLSAFGPKILTDSFLAAWRTANEGTPNIREDTLLSTKLAYLTASLCSEKAAQIDEIPLDGIKILDILVLLSDMDSDTIENVKDQLVDCILKFWTALPDVSKAKAYEMANDVIKKQEPGRIWLCVTDTLAPGGPDETGNRPPVEVMGYVYMGRETTSTIAVRNVFIQEKWRGRKLAAPLVYAACRYWLLEGGAPIEKRKGAVSLFVEPSNRPATMAYMKCGFIIREEEWARSGFEGVNPGNF
ncbi:hypothetical protein FRC18_011603 [Serendipita sp. 400]|nr:hypothetical protein FRC18_011603 [Serendipita sp. 400]